MNLARSEPCEVRSDLACGLYRSLLASALQPLQSTRYFERMQSSQVVVERCQVGKAEQARGVLGPCQLALPLKHPVRKQATALGVVDLTSSPPAPPPSLLKESEDVPTSLAPMAKGHSTALSNLPGGSKLHARNELSVQGEVTHLSQEAAKVAAELRARLLQKDASQSSSLPASRVAKEQVSPSLKQTLLTSSMRLSPKGPGVTLNHRPDRARDAAAASLKQNRGKPEIDVQKLWAEAEKAQELQNYNAAKKHKDNARKNGKPGGLSNLKAMIKRQEQEDAAGRRMWSEGQRPAPGQDPRQALPRYSTSSDCMLCVPVDSVKLATLFKLRLLTTCWLCSSNSIGCFQLCGCPDDPCCAGPWEEQLTSIPHGQNRSCRAPLHCLRSKMASWNRS